MREMVYTYTITMNNNEKIEYCSKNKINEVIQEIANNQYIHTIDPNTNNKFVYVPNNICYIQYNPDKDLKNYELIQTIDKQMPLRQNIVS